MVVVTRSQQHQRLHWYESCAVPLLSLPYRRVSELGEILLVLMGIRIKQTHVALRQPVICFNPEVCLLG